MGYWIIGVVLLATSNGDMKQIGAAALLLIASELSEIASATKARGK